MSLIRKGNLWSVYKANLVEQYEGNEESVKKEMQQNAENIFRFHVAHNSKYRKFLDSKGFDYSDLSNVVWEKIPIITKDDLRRFYPELQNETYNYTSSGGSTSIPFKYPSSKESALNIWPAHWIMHEMCGIKPFEKMLMLMAYDNNKKKLIKRLYHWLSNFVTFSSFTMNDEQMMQMYKTIVSKNIKTIYGYSSSINQFLRFLKTNNLHLNLKGIFTTSDNKIPSSYILAREYCNCDVFNQYGAHDGDMFSFECKEHCGLHIMHRMSTVEIIEKEIILTAVRNKAFPFIRYKVGDIAEGDNLITTKCKCGRTLFRIEGLSGRNTYQIKDTDGKEISVMLFTYPFDDDYNILQYQVLEEGNMLKINIITDVYKVEQLEKLYRPFLQSKLKREVEILVNREIYKLPNAKVPLFYKVTNN